MNNPAPAPRVPVEWQSRVIEDKAALDAKRKELEVYIGSLEYAKLDRQDQLLLLEQRTAMLDYSQILRDRIARFK